MTDDRVAWLTAQLDADEQAVRAVEGIRQPWYFEMIDDDARPLVELALDPARVLRRVTSARRTLELHDRDHECSVYDSHGEVDNCAWILKGDACSTVLLMFGEYADRPGYLPEWGPQ